MMKNFRFLILFMILTFTLPYTYGGCGGGGGGSDSGIVYSGLTTSAALTDANAEDLSGGALGAGLIGDHNAVVGLLLAAHSLQSDRCWHLVAACLSSCQSFVSSSVVCLAGKAAEAGAAISSR